MSCFPPEDAPAAWLAYLRNDSEALGDDAWRLDAAEEMIHHQFGISPACYVRANEHPVAAKLADIVAALVLKRDEWMQAVPGSEQPVNPSVGRIAHYVSYGTPGGEYLSQCRAAVITEVNGPGEDNAVRVSLAVLNPEGMFFNREVPQYELPPSGKILPGERSTHPGGTWHWPERVG